MNGEHKNQQLGRWLFQLRRAVYVIGRRLPQKSINGEFIEEMINLIGHVESLEQQLVNPLVRQSEYIVILMWKATRECNATI